MKKSSLTLLLAMMFSVSALQASQPVLGDSPPVSAVEQTTPEIDPLAQELEQAQRVPLDEMASGENSLTSKFFKTDIKGVTVSDEMESQVKFSELYEDYRDLQAEIEEIEPEDIQNYSPVQREALETKLENFNFLHENLPKIIEANSALEDAMAAKESRSIIGKLVDNFKIILQKFHLSSGSPLANKVEALNDDLKAKLDSISKGYAVTDAHANTQDSDSKLQKLLQDEGLGDDDYGHLLEGNASIDDGTTSLQNALDTGKDLNDGTKLGQQDQKLAVDNPYHARQSPTDPSDEDDGDDLDF